MPRRTAIVAVSIALGLAACGDDGEAADPTTTTGEATTTSAAPEPLSVLVTNDDGIGHAGIDTLVTALDAVEGLEVVVVAPAEDRTGTSDSTTPGGASSADGETISGYPGTAVDGFPADTIAVALDAGVEPDLVVSGINQGQNVGPLAYASGTVGAARTAVRAGIPAIAGSAGLGDGTDYAAVADLIVAYIEEHRAEYADGTADATAVVSFNIPECSAGTVKDLLEVPLASVIPPGVNPFATDCSVDVPEAPADDVAAIGAGHATVSVVPPEAPAA